MMSMDVNNIKKLKQRIGKESGLSIVEIERMMRQKQTDLKGLIKEEAALTIVAKELGVDIYPIEPPESNAELSSDGSDDELPKPSDRKQKNKFLEKMGG